MNLDRHNDLLSESLRWAMEWIDAVPKNTALPDMPSLDRDQISAVLSRPQPDASQQNKDLIQSLRSALAWITAVPADTPLPLMPGFDWDHVQAVLEGTDPEAED